MAMKRDSATGDSIKIAVINKKGFKEYTGDDLEKILK
jgi:20S proteasome alpha/beta subunit